jgi:hypothetical protein
LPFEEDGAAGRLVEPVEEAEEGGLARAAGTDKGDDISLIDVDGHVVDDSLVGDDAS